MSEQQPPNSEYGDILEKMKSTDPGGYTFVTLILQRARRASVKQEISEIAAEEIIKESLEILFEARKLPGENARRLYLESYFAYPAEEGARRHYPAYDENKPVKKRIRKKINKI